MAKKGQFETLKLKTVAVPIVGETPLLMHRFSEKAAGIMLGKHMGTASAGREAKEPTLELIRALYLLGGEGFGMPTVAFKAAAVRGADMTGMLAMAKAKTAFRVEGPMNLVQVFGVPEMDVQPARNNQTMDIRIRPRFDEWGALVLVRFNEGQLSVEQVHQLFQAGGFGAGLGDWRQERDGINGSFRVGTAQEVDAIKSRAAAATKAFFKEHAEVIARVRSERSQLWALIEREAPAEQLPDESKKVAKPRPAKSAL